jgi:hypothetical protein
MSASSGSEFYDTEEEDDAQMGDMINEGLKHAYGDETWTQQSFTYAPKPKALIGRRGTMQFFEHFPTVLQLFEFFWPFNLMRKIVIETNRYATERIDAA